MFHPDKNNIVFGEKKIVFIKLLMTFEDIQEVQCCHKCFQDWVVSKFGRVLPVLQLKAQKGSRARTLKYDPSKYSHNIRKLDRAGGADLPTPVTPVTQLTWEVQGGDDDISKKRRGEFPLYEPPRRKKGRADAGSARDAEGAAR